MEEIKFKDFINYSKPIGKMLIVGIEEGAGKTLLLTRIGIGKMLNGMEDCYKSYGYVDEYNSLGYNFSKNYEHLCFSNFDINCKGTLIPDRKVYVCNYYRVGYFDPNYYTDFYPPCALFCMTEGKNYLDSYKWEKFPERYISWLKTMRQGRYDMVVDSQVSGDICTAYKRICGRFIYLHKKCEEIRNSKGELIGHKLFVIEWNDYRDLELFEKTTRKQNFKEYILIIDDVDNGLYDNYDSYYCRLLHLKGREEQDFRIEYFPEINTIEDIDYFADEFGFNMPEDFLKRNYKKKVDLEITDKEDEDFGF